MSSDHSASCLITQHQMPIWWITILCFWIVSPNLGFVNHQNTPNWSKPNSTGIIPHDHNFQTQCCCCCCYCFGVVGHVVHAFQVALFRQISIPGFPDCFPQGRFLWITRNTPNWSNPNSTQFNPHAHNFKPEGCCVVGGHVAPANLTNFLSLLPSPCCDNSQNKGPRTRSIIWTVYKKTNVCEIP